MSETVIETCGLTKNYGNGRGIFDINLEVKKGEVFGYVGTNSSGKTTTIRSMMGFIRPSGGSSAVLGIDSWRSPSEIMKNVSYVPGEIAFPSLSTGTAFLKSQAEYLGVKDYTYMNHLIELLQLDPSANLKRMSKGMKQKTAIVAALMGEKDILVLDEPTTGLDPLMRDAFLDLIREEKAKGHTVFMSSNIFEEIEEVCDRVALITDGKIVDIASLYDLRHSKTKDYTVIFQNNGDAADFAASCEFSVCPDGRECRVKFPAAETGAFLNLLKNYTIQALHENKITLEDYFMKAYGKGKNNNGN
ncbi:MAG: ABC transporter ATP-binding protein [Clostridiales bacterium]|nr:ABC transporter ATP-binding protein [Clostridiales bacterium]